MMKKNVIVANYSGGNTLFWKNNDAALGKPNKWFSIMEGSNAKRQEGPHVHMVHFLRQKVCAV
jgi:6-phosphogluconolactonase